jgi:hypothetical protein
LTVSLFLLLKSAAKMEIIHVFRHQRLSSSESDALDTVTATAFTAPIQQFSSSFLQYFSSFSLSIASINATDWNVSSDGHKSVRTSLNFLISQQKYVELHTRAVLKMNAKMSSIDARKMDAIETIDRTQLQPHTRAADQY